VIPIAYNLRSLAARRSTTAAAALGIGLVVFVFASVLMLAHGLEETMRATGSNSNAIIMRKGAQAEMQSGIEEATVGILRSSPEAASSAQGSMSTAEVVILITAATAGGEGVTNAAVRGVSPESFLLRDMVKIVEGRNFTPGTDEVIVGRGIAHRLARVQVGQELALKRNRPV